MRSAMIAYRTFRTALRALLRNPLRAMLTTLGIVIGVAAVIAMMEIGAGSSAAIRKSISSMGANVLDVRPGAASSGGVTFGSGSTQTLTPEDAEAIARECPAVSNVVPLVHTRTQVVYGSRNWVPTFIFGSTPKYLEVQNWTVAQGSFFTDRDVANANKVCVLGQTLVRELFQGEDPIGKEIRIKNISFRVVGVLGSKGANMMGMDQDDIILAPWTTIKYRVTGAALSDANASSSSSSTSSAVNSLSNLYPVGQPELYPEKSEVQAADNPMPVRFASIDHIQASARSTEEIPAAIRQITELLRERHHIRPGEADDFSIRDMTQMVKALTSTTTMMTNLLLSVAMISLVVGGVGIMNIMLVSVTERTREIGLRMAVGARARDILRQFMVEAVVLCLVGGALGILLGHGGSLLVRLLLRWPVETSPVAIAAAVLVSASVGMMFGFYPAWKASRLDPIEALRYE
jgi:ABC-type antimicrobial peptide transport system permease subunit